MIIDFDPGDKVVNPTNKEWGIGQVQSIINGKITVNFENVWKIVINSKNIRLEKYVKWNYKIGEKLLMVWLILF